MSPTLIALNLLGSMCWRWLSQLFVCVISRAAALTYVLTAALTILSPVSKAKDRRQLAVLATDKLKQ
jgi:hypothetical protein